MVSLRIDLISEKCVKPRVSTPPPLRNYKLSMRDQLMDNLFVPVAFFYPNPANEMSSLLQESLSETLSSYYPYAGRLVNNIYVDCNDMGATFLEARIGCPMSDILDADGIAAQDVIFPSGIPWRYVRNQSSLTVVQLTHFDCGGKALTVCLCHKLGDGHTMINFINDWAAITRDSSWKPCPVFNGSSILPPKDDPSFGGYEEVEQYSNCVTKMFVFDSEKLTLLKAKAKAESGVPTASRFEVAIALLYKCGIKAFAASSGSFKPSSLTMAMNLRSLLCLPDAVNYAGNLISNFSVYTNDEKVVDFAGLVKEIRQEKKRVCEKYKGMETKELGSVIEAEIEEMLNLERQNAIEGYLCTSWCKFPMYGADFGWGRPSIVKFASSPFKNFFILTDDDKEDGMHATVALEEQVMSVFQNDPELLQFAS